MTIWGSLFSLGPLSLLKEIPTGFQLRGLSPALSVLEAREEEAGGPTLSHKGGCNLQPILGRPDK